MPRQPSKPRQPSAMDIGCGPSLLAPQIWSSSRASAAEHQQQSISQRGKRQRSAECGSQGRVCPMLLCLTVGRPERWCMEQRVAISPIVSAGKEDRTWNAERRGCGPRPLWKRRDAYMQSCPVEWRAQGVGCVTPQPNPRRGTVLSGAIPCGGQEAAASPHSLVCNDKRVYAESDCPLFNGAHGVGGRLVGVGSGTLGTLGTSCSPSPRQRVHCGECKRVQEVCISSDPAADRGYALGEPERDPWYHGPEVRRGSCRPVRHGVRAE